MSGAFKKDPNAVLDYKQDWATNTNQSTGTDWLASGETITAATVTADSGLTVDSDSITDTNTSVTFWLSGGTAGTEYNVVVHITTSASREDDRTMVIRCVER